MGDQRGQATVEWTAVLLVVAAVLAGGAVVISMPWLAHTIRCAVGGGCHGQDSALERSYGNEVAGYVAAYAPNMAYENGQQPLPVDFRRCRSRECSDIARRRGASVAASEAGVPPTIFTRAVDRRGQGGDLFLQYWLYYPDSTYQETAHRIARFYDRVNLGIPTPHGRVAHAVAGHHEDDWESYQVRVRPNGTAEARASAHHGYAGELRWPNLNELPDRVRAPDVIHGRWVRPRRTGAWTPASGWTRVSRGSHAGHIVPGARGERHVESERISLIPLERLSAADRRTEFAITPPWEKDVYEEPEATGT